MLSNEEQLEIEKLSNENPKFGIIIKRLNEESKFMLSKISHEIRNPLTLLNSTLQLLESKNPEVIDIKYWDQITSDVNDLILLLDDLSKFNNCETLSLSNTNLLKLITEVKNSFHTETKKRNINLSLHMNITQNHIDNYLCDPIKMKQVFINIIKNAIDAIHENGIIEINLEGYKKKDSTLSMNSIENLIDSKSSIDSIDSINSIDFNSFIKITISNNGNPIPKEEIESIFVPFITYKPGGTGLGLAIVSKIIIAHNGTIHVDSKDSLTTFTILLPIKNL